MIDCYDPLAVFRAGVAAINAEDWAGAAALVDPVSLRAMHRMAVEGLSEPPPSEVLTVDELLRRAPETPRAVAEGLVARAAQEMDPALRLAREFPAISSTEQLRGLTPSELFGHWLEGKSRRRKYEGLVAAGRVPAEALAARGNRPFGGYPYVAVGSVADGETLTHVLYRLDMFPHGRRPSEVATFGTPRPPDEEALKLELVGRTPVYVATFRRQPDGCWRFVMTDDFLRMRAMSEQGVGVLRTADKLER